MRVYQLAAAVSRSTRRVIQLDCRRMQKTFGAIYENGVFRPLEPLQLAERQRVALTIEDTVTSETDSHLLDLEFLSSLEFEVLPEVTLEEVQAVLAKIPGSMSEAFTAEREERF